MRYNIIKNIRHDCYELWLPKDMEHMGYIFEYCDERCKELYNIKIDKVKLMDASMKSKFRKEMEEGHLRFLSQSSYDSIKQWINVDYSNNPIEFAVKR